eukprot:CAMPEP_0177756240 /NCGR_PEP_ID=MMETSP0491_2-20121128/2999_1 /TAXON_ID=63592 /ORGANISM="Tetraselmis chuii, Strain PLY429" /LENGTH=647 /DNA_ID=CAMNT_0019271801 /DNA_START=262 /DNA_END=2205 /DNA_ORIENTATION=+
MSVGCTVRPVAAVSPGATGSVGGGGGLRGGAQATTSRPSAARTVCPALQAPRQTRTAPTSAKSAASTRVTPAVRTGTKSADGKERRGDDGGPDDTDVQRGWRRWDWVAGYGYCHECPEGYWLEVEGRLPVELEGTYFRNGPGKLDVEGRDRVAHPFDADGMVMSVAIRNGRAFFRSRFVNTAEHAAEREAGHRLFRGSFGTRLPGGFWTNFLEIAPRNAANTNIVCWGDRCLALFEAGQPYRVDASTLETSGVETLGGALRQGLPFSSKLPSVDVALGKLLDVLRVASPLPEGVRLGGDAFSAHPHTCKATGRTVTYSYRINVVFRGAVPRLETVFTFYELDDQLAVLSEMDYSLDGYAFVHDFQVTDGHYVLIQNPVSLNLVPFLLGTKSAVESVRFHRDRNTKVHLIPRPAEPNLLANACPTRDAATVVEVDPCFIFHLSNAHEERRRGGGEGTSSTRFTVDCVRYPEMPDFQDFMGHGAGFEYVHPERQPKSELWRIEIDKEAGEARSRRVSERVLEFACCAPDATVPRYTYAAAALHPYLNMPQQAIARLDMDTGETALWTRGTRYYVGEPQFIAKADAVDVDVDDGWLVAMCFDAAALRSEMIVMDAADIEGGPVAVCKLRHSVPHGLHGGWSTSYFGPDEE